MSDNEAVSNISFNGAQEMLIWCHLKTTQDKNNSKEFVFLQTHIFKDVSFKLTQVNKYLAKKMKTTPNVPVIVAGNINREPSQRSIKKVMEGNYIDLFELQNLQSNFDSVLSQQPVGKHVDIQS